MAGYAIGETAERSGFSPSTLRYYEHIDLLRPARSEAGYRMYDEAALARLAFIARAKQLGCALEEIRDLVAVWEDDRCTPVQQRLHALVTAKRAAARTKIAELTAFLAQLDAAAAHLAGPATDGPCDDRCACTTVAAPVDRDDRRVVACSLDSDALHDRVDQWRTMLRNVRARATSPSGTVHVELDDDIDLAALARLVVAEQHCCPFFSFTITVDHRGITLEADAPDGADALVSELFGGPSDPRGAAHVRE